MNQRTVSFPKGADFGDIHYEHGRSWEFVEPGMWKSVGGSGSGAGAGMVISATEPEDKVDGMQWLESTTARVWIWDEDKWLEFPAADVSQEIYWDDVLGKPIPIENLAGSNAGKVSMISGGNY